MPVAEFPETPLPAAVRRQLGARPLLRHSVIVLQSHA